MAAQKVFIAVAGDIGTGKTTLTKMLATRFGWNPHYEEVANNPYLSDFYADMHRWSFPLQIFFLNNRFRAHQKISQGENSAIQDRTVYEDANIFARNLHEQGQMQPRDYENYLGIYDVMTKLLSPPDLIVYLRKSSRVQEPDRSTRADLRSIPDSYLSNQSVL